MFHHDVTPAYSGPSVWASAKGASLRKRGSAARPRRQRGKKGHIQVPRAAAGQSWVFSFAGRVFHRGVPLLSHSRSTRVHSRCYRLFTRPRPAPAPPPQVRRRRAPPPTSSARSAVCEQLPPSARHSGRTPPPPTILAAKSAMRTWQGYDASQVLVDDGRAGHHYVCPISGCPNRLPKAAGRGGRRGVPECGLGSTPPRHSS